MEGETIERDKDETTIDRPSTHQTFTSSSYAQPHRKENERQYKANRDSVKPQTEQEEVQLGCRTVQQNMMRGKPQTYRKDFTQDHRGRGKNEKEK